MINLTLTDQTLTIPAKTRVADLAESMNLKQIVGCILNGKVHDLNYLLKKSGSFEWIHEDSAIGKLMKERTLTFLLIVAVKQLFQTDVRVQHTLASGLYITLNDRSSISQIDASAIQKQMMKMILEDVPIHRHVVLKEEAVEHFEKLKRYDLAKLLSQRTSLTSSIYSCEGVDDYFYGVMATHANMVGSFTLIPYQKGLWLSFQTEFKDQPKLFHVFERFEQRGQNIGITNIADLNEAIAKGKLKQLIELNEQRVQDDLNQIAANIHQNKASKVVLVAGPSSAGKTTFSKRLAENLSKLGHNPMTLSMDDFFKNRVDSPRLPDGSYDFENIE